MIQLITSDEMTNVNLINATLVHKDASAIKVLVNSELLTEKENDLLNSEDGFFFSLNPDQDLVKTKSHFITTSVKNGGSAEALSDNQWLIEFEL